MSITHESELALYKVPKAAKMLDASTATVRRLVQRGELAAVRIGRSVLIPRSSLERFIEGRIEDAERASVALRTQNGGKA